MLNGVQWQIYQTRQRLQREWRAHRRRSQQQAMVLMYHRVAEKDIDPWRLCVTPENFEAHLQVLKQHMQPMSLTELAIAQQSGNVPERAVAITFDDGYANNLYQAKPLLAKYGIPATVFVSTGYTDRNREFWWDELERVLLQLEELPPTLTLTLNDQSQYWDLGTAIYYSKAEYQADHNKACWEAKTGSRLYLYRQIWALLQPLDESQRQAALDAILSWAKVDIIQRETHRPMTCEELLLLEADDVVSIGAHTVNHPMLSKRSLDDQQQEIADSKAYLERLLSHAVDTFAYPFGAYCPETKRLLSRAGFLCACTTTEETVWQGNSCYELPRFDVVNCSGKIFEERILRWFKQGYAE